MFACEQSRLRHVSFVCIATRTVSAREKPLRFTALATTSLLSTNSSLKPDAQRVLVAVSLRLGMLFCLQLAVLFLVNGYLCPTPCCFSFSCGVKVHRYSSTYSCFIDLLWCRALHVDCALVRGVRACTVPCETLVPLPCGHSHAVRPCFQGLRGWLSHVVRSCRVAPPCRRGTLAPFPLGCSASHVCDSHDSCSRHCIS